MHLQNVPEQNLVKMCMWIGVLFLCAHTLWNQHIFDFAPKLLKLVFVTLASAKLPHRTRMMAKATGEKKHKKYNVAGYAEKH